MTNVSFYVREFCFFILKKFTFFILFFFTSLYSPFIYLSKKNKFAYLSVCDTHRGSEISATLVNRCFVDAFRTRSVEDTWPEKKSGSTEIFDRFAISYAVRTCVTRACTRGTYTLARDCTRLRYFHSASSRCSRSSAMDRRSVHWWPPQVHARIPRASAKQSRRHVDNSEGGLLAEQPRKSIFIRFDLESLRSRCSYVRASHR